ncbi:MAG: SLC13 family permease, partial [Syntrophobacteraceae bacterium]
YLLITEKVRLDITSLGVLVVIMVTGLLTPAETLSAFSNTAVITVAAMFMISRGLMRTGALGFISERIIRYSQGNLKKILLAVLFLAAIPSA